MTFREFIYEMANPQSFAVQKIEEILPVTITHVFKCLLMPNDRAINHHIHNVTDWLFQMDDLADTKTNRARPTQKLLLKEYKAKFADFRLSKYVYKVKEKYNIKRDIPKTELDEHFEFVREFFRDFFLDIENNSVDLKKYDDILRDKIKILKEQK